jgi:hypothetical protein
MDHFIEFYHHLATGDARNDSKQNHPEQLHEQRAPAIVPNQDER